MLSAAENRRKVAVLQAGGTGAEQLLGSYAERNEAMREQRARAIARDRLTARRERRRTPRRRASGKGNVEAPLPVASESTGDRFIREYAERREETS
jgi:hypothetical protein